jgi:undecaprenyl-diphosphatase
MRNRKKKELKFEKSKKNINKIILASLLILAAFLLSLYFDSYISVFFSSLRGDFLNYIFLTIEFFSSGIILPLVIAAIFLTGERFRKIYKILFVLIVSYSSGILLKTIFDRARPYYTGIVTTFDKLIESSFTSWNSSFPSMHAIMVFCIVPFFFDEKKSARISWMIFAVLVVLSRVYLGVHYLSDVIAGAVVGYLIGFFIYKIKFKYTRDKDNLTLKNAKRK